jgi:translation elongation factor EF-1alpha
VISYRIRQVIDTAAASFTADYIDTVQADITISCAVQEEDQNQIQIIPNPASRSFILKMTQAAAINDLNIVIFNAKGQQVSQQKTTKPAGITLIPVSIHQLASGKYYVVIYNGAQQLATEELIKL